MMLRNLATAVLEHGKITTTLAKAKETQPIVENLITLAKDGWDLAKFRRVLSVVTRKSIAYNLYFESTVPNPDGKGTKTIPAVAPRFKQRRGGYTRIYKLAKVRQGDASRMAILALLKPEEKVAAKPVKPKVTPARE
jgi:large subunit ribosomal protein L17